MARADWHFRIEAFYTVGLDFQLELIVKNGAEFKLVIIGNVKKNNAVSRLWTFKALVQWI